MRTKNKKVKEACLDSVEKTDPGRIMRQTKQTAAERYVNHRHDIGVLISLIQEELACHAAQAEHQPNDWGFAGDLSHVRKSLKDILLFLIGPRFASRAEASQFIEDHIESVWQTEKRNDSKNRSL